MTDARKKLINFLVSVRRMPPLSELSGDEERMLFELYAMAQDKDPLVVTDVYKVPGFHSRSTSYRTLIALRDKGIVTFDASDVDGRKRHVRFTPVAEHIFARFA